jgi:pyruvate formate lyase activating enzyme
MKRRDLILTLSCSAALPVFGSLFKKSNMAEGQIFRKDGPKKPWKWSKQAYHYEKSGGKTKCLVCPNHCELDHRDRSACRVKVNIDGTVYTLAYGNPCAIHVDPIEKKPLFHFYPKSRAFSIATAGCNLRCLNCQNWEISQKKPEEVRHYDLFPEEAVETALQYKCESIAYTYSEPTAFYEYMFDTAKIAREKGIKNVWVTNGYMSRAALEPFCQYLDGANVDLKSFSEATYNELNGGHLKYVLETLKVLHEYKVHFEITTLMVPTYTDNMDTVKQISNWVLKNLGPDYPIHFSRFHPQHKLQHMPPTSVDNLVQARETAMAMGLHYVFVGNVPGLNLENTLCPSCRKTLIERWGYTIKKYYINGSGRCKFCKTKIAGRF